MSSTLHKIKDKLTGDSTTSGTTSTSTQESSSGYNTRSGQQHTAYEEAPVVREHEHHHTDHVDKTKRDEIHEQDKVNTVIQPIQDQQRKDTKHHQVDEGVSVHEHGSRGLDQSAEDELRRRRDEIARQGGTEYSESHSHTDERKPTHVEERTNTIEQVQPVIERDIDQHHRVEHNKKEIDIVHEPTKVGSTQVAPTVTVDEYNRQH